MPEHSTKKEAIRILNALAEQQITGANGKSQIQQLHEQLDIRHGAAMSRILRFAEDQGWLKQRLDTEDMRRHYIEITPKGTEYIQSNEAKNTLDKFAFMPHSEQMYTLLRSFHDENRPEELTRPVISLAEMNEVAGCLPAHMTRLLKKLEGHGYIEPRKINPKDKRNIDVEISPKGEDYYQKLLLAQRVNGVHKTHK